MRRKLPLFSASTVKVGLWAGIMGGAAEVAWIALCAHYGAIDGEAVARAVVAVPFPVAAAASWAAAAGVAVHMALALALGVAVAVALRALSPRLLSPGTEAIAVVTILVAIWAVNFGVVLPLLDSTLLGLVPAPVGFASKVLFGASAAAVLAYAPESASRSRLGKGM